VGGVHRPSVDRLIEAALGSPGDTEVAERAAAFDGTGPSGRAGDYATKVRSASFRITDADIAALRQSGLTEDAILELTIAAALGAAVTVLDDALSQLATD
jgi:hypothetical protein